MNTTRTLALFAALALAGLAGCNNAPDMPPGNDAGHDAASAPHDSGTTGDTGGTTDAGHDAATTPDDGGTDAGSDAGPCTSTMPHCNTCVTAATDPLNACSSFVTGCIPFDNTRVPGWPDHIPAVTP